MEKLMNIKKYYLVFYILSGIVFVGQHARAQESKEIKPIEQTATQTTPPKTFIRPADIPYGGGTIPGDVAVNADISNLNAITAQYQKELESAKKALDDRYSPIWQQAKDATMKDIQLVKNQNHWSNNVEYDFEHRQWTAVGSLTIPAPVVASVKVIPQAKSTKKHKHTK
jgi:hypothetical protein